MLFLLKALIAAPVELGMQILEKLRDEVDKERLATEESVKEKLLEYQTRLDSGEISEEEYDEAENFLLERLAAIRKSREKR